MAISDYHSKIAEDAIVLAEKWQDDANKQLSRKDLAVQNQMARLLTHPSDKVIIAKIIDQCFRSGNPFRIADQIHYIAGKLNIPAFFSPLEQLLFRMFLVFGRHVPNLCVPMVIDRIITMCSKWVTFGKEDVINGHLETRKRQGVSVNINHIGEIVLGEKEAEQQLDIYLQDLAKPEIDSVSVKISSIYSQIRPIAFDHGVHILTQRLCRLFKTAKEHVYIRNDGKKVFKTVNLDMESYQDLDMTYTAFTRALDQMAFKNYFACIALQAYIPDSFSIQRKLTQWAQQRVKCGGSPIKIRLVKGANLEMEKVESSHFNWPLATYDNKIDVDANFKQMIAFGMKEEHIKAVHLGIASHNLFDLAYAYIMAERNNVTSLYSFEMLEGMADHVRKVLSETSDILIYTPVASKEKFIHAIAYLTRRLDENTAKENFLRYACSLQTGSKEWLFLKNQFIASLNRMDTLSESSHRIQNRASENLFSKDHAFIENEFVNEADTDFCLEENRNWATSIITKWSKKKAVKIPVVVAGKRVFKKKETKAIFDYSRIDDDGKSPLPIAVFAMADEKDIHKAVKAAKKDPDQWRNKTVKERQSILFRAAENLRHRRSDLIGACAASTGKIFTEADSEVSEAVDFTMFYPYSANMFENMPNVACKGKGVGLVISPWNFPIAIPCGGIVAALASGNTVVLKPSSYAVLTAWMLCEAFWDAGVSENTLQFLPCEGDCIGSLLASNLDIDFIIFTGSTTSGLSILNKRPDVYLAAETGGKNATIVTSMSDREQAIKHVIHSAFSHCGQKCSATSLLILEKEVYEDKIFKKQLVDAAGSLLTGSPWHFENTMGPLIHPPTDCLKRAIEQLDTGESWALKPEYIKGNQRMLTPGIKWGVKPGSFTHMTELFGPVLAVMKADNLAHAIDIANQTGYGLTSGLESLDEREQRIWKKEIQTGNLYINKGTTGAIVLRQPFGGMGKSSIGPGIKAGGMNYVSQFMTFEETSYPPTVAMLKEHPLMRLAQSWQQKLDGREFKHIRKDIKKTIRAIMSYLYHYEQEFNVEKDYFHLRGQDNIIRYIPAGNIMIRLHENDTLFDMLARIAAASISGCSFTVSIPQGFDTMTSEFLYSTEGKRLVDKDDMVYHSEKELAALLHHVDRIRYAAPDRVSQEVCEAAAKIGFYIAKTKVMMEGRIELLQYYREQSICNNYHRFGNLGERAWQEE